MKNILFGGVIILMFNDVNDFINLPENIEYLFGNIVLDTASFLCVLGCFKKKNIELDEFLFYYSLSASYVDLRVDNNTLNFGTRNAKYEIDSLFLYIKDHAQFIITYLANNELIDLSVDKTKYPYNILISINNKGKNHVEKLENKYFYELIQRTKEVIKSAKYTKSNRDKVFRGEYYDAYENK